MSAVPLTSKPADDHDDDQDHHYQYLKSSCNISSSSICEIEEEDQAEAEDEDDGQLGSSIVPNEIKELFGIKRYQQPMPSIKEDHDHDDHSIYVGVGKSESSMDALTWTLNHASSSSSTIVYLVHVFPEIKYIPSPLGKLPKSQVSPEQVEIFMAQETGKRRALLQKFLDKCSAAKVKVDTVMIESDMIGRALVDLIPILNITRLVVGTNKSNLRKLMSRKGAGGIADQVLRNAPEGCEIKIICEGNQVMMDQAAIDDESLSPRTPRTIDDTIITTDSMQHQQQRNEAFSWMCFKSPKFT